MDSRALVHEIRKSMRSGYRHFLGVRLDELTNEMLLRLTKYLGKDKSEVVRLSIITAYAYFVEKTDPKKVLEKIIESGEL